MASKLASVWSMLDDMREKINIDSNWIVSLLDPLFLLTEKVYLSRKNNVSENVGHVINFATADSSLSFFLMDRTSCLLASCSQLVSQPQFIWTQHGHCLQHGHVATSLD